MQNEDRDHPKQFHSPQQEPAKAPATQAGPGDAGQGTPEDFLEMKRWVQQARGDAERARTIAEQTREDIKDIRWELEDHGKKAKGSFWTTGALALLLIAACAYGYYRLESDRSLLAQFPAVQNSLDAIGQRVSSAEEKFRTWASDWDGMSDRLGKVERNSSAVLRQARDYATVQTAKVQQQLQAELNNRSQSLTSSIGELEASQEQNQQQMAQLQQEISSVRSETHSQLAQAEEHTSREIGEIHSALARNRDDFDMVARNLDRRRLDFEISKDRTTEVASGVTLTVSDFNVSYQRVEGRLHLIKDGRILWIRGQGIQQPVRFYSMTDNRPFEVVFTRVNRDSAVGYILAPADMAPAASTDSPAEPMATMRPDAAANLALAR